jgi:hypothetical protein
MSAAAAESKNLKRSALPGLLGGPAHKYQADWPRTKRTTTCIIDPSGGFDVNSPTIRFDKKFADDEIVR